MTAPTLVSRNKTHHAHALMQQVSGFCGALWSLLEWTWQSFQLNYEAGSSVFVCCHFFNVSCCCIGNLVQPDINVHLRWLFAGLPFIWTHTVWLGKSIKRMRGTFHFQPLSVCRQAERTVMLWTLIGMSLAPSTRRYGGPLKKAVSYSCDKSFCFLGPLTFSNFQWCVFLGVRNIKLS